MDGEYLSTQIGSDSDCPFCLARREGLPKEGSPVLVLSGYKVGTEGLLVSQMVSGQRQWLLQTDPNDVGERIAISPTRELIASHDCLRVPRWFPPFDLVRSSRIEEICWQFCSASFVGKKFHWKDQRVASLIATVWDGRIDLHPEEFSGILVAHGMPTALQGKLEEHFRIGQRCLIAGRRFKPVKKWRTPEAVSDQFSEVLRYSYQWMPQ